jgi:hypothetical protein
MGRVAFEQIGEAVRQSIDSVYAQDSALVSVKTSGSSRAGTERALVAYLFVELQKHVLPLVSACGFACPRVDFEYSRMLGDPKSFATTWRGAARVGRDRSTASRLIVPDLIVHDRGSNRNLLAIEVKPAARSSATADENDHAKLALLTGRVDSVYVNDKRGSPSSNLKFAATEGHDQWECRRAEHLRYDAGVWVRFDESSYELRWWLADRPVHFESPIEHDHRPCSRSGCFVERFSPIR